MHFLQITIFQIRNFYGNASTELKLVKMSFSIVACFIFTYCFENIIFIISSFYRFGPSSTITIFDYVTPTINFFMTLNTSINIIFYCIFSETFKTTLFKMFYFSSDKKVKEISKTEMTDLGKTI